jgi:hypothetical protein
MSWWRQHWRWVLALAFAGSLGFVVFIILYVMRKKAEAEKLRGELELLKAGAKVEGLLADKTARAKELAQNAAVAKKLDDEIAAAKRKAVATVKSVEGLSDADVANEFRDLGY